MRVAGAILLGIAACSCGKEKSYEIPSYNSNWFVNKDGAGADHNIYEFYTETGIPVFYNDAIGAETRVDIWGNQYVHIERLKLTFGIGGLTSLSVKDPAITDYTPCTKSDIPAALDFLRREVLPENTSSLSVRSIFLVEDMDASFGYYAFKGWNTVMISKISRIPKMSASEKRKYRAEVVSCLFLNEILGRHEAQVAQFNKITTECAAKPIINLYGLFIDNLVNPSYIRGATASSNCRSIGFLAMDSRNTNFTPNSPWLDVMQYVQEIIMRNDAEFRSIYGSYPLIIQKYEIMCGIMDQIGIKR